MIHTNPRLDKLTILAFDITSSRSLVNLPDTSIGIVRLILNYEIENKILLVVSNFQFCNRFERKLHFFFF